MTRKQLLAFALVLSFSSAAWSGEAKDDTIDGAWLPSAAELAGRKFPDDVRNTMKLVSHLVVAIAILSEARAQDVKRDIPYAEPAQERQVLDVYSPHHAKSLPVVFWIHGGGWQTGDKASVQIKPQVFVERGFVFVSTNYRLLPSVDMATIVRDIARCIRWVHEHIAEHGGDPPRP